MSDCSGTFDVDLEDAEDRQQTLARATTQLMGLAEKVLNKPLPIPKPRPSKANKYIKTLKVVRDVFMETDKNVEQIYKVHVLKTNPELINQMIANKISETQQEIDETQRRKSSTRKSTSESRESRSSTRSSGSFTPISSNLAQKESWQANMREMTTPNTTASNSISTGGNTSSSSKFDLRTAGKPHMINIQHLMKKMGKEKKEEKKSRKQKYKASQRSNKSIEVERPEKSPVSFKTFVRRDMQNEPVSLKSMDNITLGKCHPHMVKAQDSKNYIIMNDKEIYPSPTQTPSQKTSMTWWNSSEENTCCPDLNMQSTQKLDTSTMKLTSDEEMDKTQIKTPPIKKKQMKRSKKMQNTQIPSLTSLIDESFPMEKSGSSIASTKMISSRNFEFMERTQTPTPKSNKNTNKYIEDPMEKTQTQTPKSNKNSNNYIEDPMEKTQTQTPKSNKNTKKYIEDPMEKTQNKTTRSERKERTKRGKSERNMNRTQIQTPKSNLHKIEDTTPKSRTQSKSARSAIQKTQSITPNSFIENPMDKTQPVSLQSKFNETQLSNATESLMGISSMEKTQSLSRKSTRESLPTPRLGYSMDWTQVIEPINLEWTESETLMGTQTASSINTMEITQVSSSDPFEISDFEDSMEKTQITSPRNLREKNLSEEESLENTQVSSKRSARSKNKTGDNSENQSMENTQASPSSGNKSSLRIGRHEILTLTHEQLEKMTNEIFTSPDNTNIEDNQREKEHEFYRNIGLEVETPEYDITEDETLDSWMDLTQSLREKFSSKTYTTHKISLDDTQREEISVASENKPGSQKIPLNMDETQREETGEVCEMEKFSYTKLDGDEFEKETKQENDRNSGAMSDMSMKMEDTQREETPEYATPIYCTSTSDVKIAASMPVLEIDACKWLSASGTGIMDDSRTISSVEIATVQTSSSNWETVETVTEITQGEENLVQPVNKSEKSASHEIQVNMEETQREEINEATDETGNVGKMEKFSYKKLDDDQFERGLKPTNVEGTKQKVADRKSSTVSDISLDMQYTQRDETPEHARYINHTSSSDAKIAASMPVLEKDACKLLSTSGSGSMEETQRDILPIENTSTASWETVETNMGSSQREENVVQSENPNPLSQMNYSAVTYNVMIEHDGNGEATGLSGDTLPYQVFINGSPFINRRP